MRWVFMVGGVLIVAVGVFNLVMAAVSPKHRRRYEMVVGDWVMAFATPVFGASYAVGAMFNQGWPLLLAPVVMVVATVRQRQWAKDRDVPPPLRRMLDVPLNPWHMIRHPVRHVRQSWDAMGHPIRSRREMRAWVEERDL